MTGQVRIQSALGVRFLAAENLLSKQFVPLPPAVPLVEVSGSDMLTTVAESIRQDAMQFRETGNFFRSTNDGGRLLLVLEPLELGERYCVLSRQALSLPPFGVEVRIAQQSESRGWHFCEIELPRSRLEFADELADRVGRYLGRLVRSAGVRVWPIDPPPHHVEADGTLIFPAGTERITVRRNGHCEVRVFGGGQVEHTARVQWLDDEWGEIDGLGPGDLLISQGDQEQFCLRIEACACFAPVGIQVDTAQGEWAMFDASACDATSAVGAMQIRLVCPSERVALSVDIDPKVWEQSGETLTFVGPEGLGRVDAGGFGALKGQEPSKSLEVPSVLDPKRVWIEGVMTRLGGSTLVNTLPWRNPTDGRGPFRLPASEELSWLGIHIKAASKE